MPPTPSNRPRARPAVARLPAGALTRGRLVAGLARAAPSWRSILVGMTLVAMAAGCYLLARNTSMFAVESIQVRGATPRVEAQVRDALASLAGTSLLRIGGDDINRRLAGLPTVAAASYDRAFPHTLRVYVRAEEALAVLRRGSDGWLVSAGGRVMRDLEHPSLSSLPRVWLPHASSVSSGAMLADESGLRGVRALAELRSRPVGARVLDVATDDQLTFLLRSGVELRLGDASNLRLKLAVARRILPGLTAPGYLDVSVPERAVVGDNPQVGD